MSLQIFATELNIWAKSWVLSGSRKVRLKVKTWPFVTSFRDFRAWKWSLIISSVPMLPSTPATRGKIVDWEESCCTSQQIWLSSAFAPMLEERGPFFLTSLRWLWPSQRYSFFPSMPPGSQLWHMPDNKHCFPTSQDCLDHTAKFSQLHSESILHELGLKMLGLEGWNWTLPKFLVLLLSTEETEVVAIQAWC